MNLQLSSWRAGKFPTGRKRSQRRRGCTRGCLPASKLASHGTPEVTAGRTHNPQTQAIIIFCGKIGWFSVSSSKTTHFQRKRWAPPFKPCPRGVHWWWSRPNWLSWRREPWLGPSKKCHLGPLWMEGKNCPRGSEKLMGTARAHRGSGIFFSAPELKN